MSLYKKERKVMMAIFFSFIAASLVGIFLFILIVSPGKLEPYLNREGQPLEGSISEKIFVQIGGVKQGMFIKSKNIHNPVLLYLHGGPAFPNYFLVDKYKPGLEDYFTICYWEQRGGGLSFSSEVTLQSVNFEQLSSDAIEVTNYLRNRFGKEKIYILAHSGGTPIALLSIAKAPLLFHAYIAMAQITNQAESEKLAYRHMLEKYEALGDKKAVHKLRAYNVLEADSNVEEFYRSAVRDASMHELGIGTMHHMNSIFWDIFIPVWTCKAYTFREKINIWKSKFSFIPSTNILTEIIEEDFTERVSNLEIPIYFVSGQQDLTVNIHLAKEYYKKLNAPFKAFYTFEKSAHSPIYEEPDRFRQIMVNDVLRQRKDLADKN
jgi:pimeloyl-ACP methyl ester carboxylesterase